MKYLTILFLIMACTSGCATHKPTAAEILSQPASAKQYPKTELACPKGRVKWCESRISHRHAECYCVDRLEAERAVRQLGRW